jgi:hypothetical protein
MQSYTSINKTIFPPILMFVASFIPDPVLAACPSSGITASSGVTNIQGNCTVVGNINLSGSATLAMTTGALFVKGNIILNDNSVFSVTAGTLIFPQTNYSQYSITLNGTSHLTMTASSFVTSSSNQTHFPMTLTATDHSVARFDNSFLNTATGSWLLGYFGNNSTLTVTNTQNLPTEIYPFDASTISVSSSSFAGMWLNFASGDMGIVNIPKFDSSGRYNFTFTPSKGNIYSVGITSGIGRIGINSHPKSTIIVNGAMSPVMNYANVVFGYYIENSTAPVVIDGLTVGGFLTGTLTHQGRNLTLNNVYINPLCWQVYVSQSNGFPTYITNSKINELAVANGIVNISDSTLQLAETVVAGPGSRLTINNTQIWSSTIQAMMGGVVNIANSHIHGNFISASGVGSKITMTNVIDSRNGTPPQSCASVGGYPPNINGVPLCNPQNPLYQCSQVTAANGATITEVPQLTCTSISKVRRSSTR